MCQDVTILMMDTLLKDRLKEIRQTRKLTQQQVADYLSVDRTTYTQYEMGKRMPSIETIKKLSRIYGCTTDYMLGQTDDPKYELRTDLPDALKKVGIEAVEMLADADLTPEEMQGLLAFVKTLKARNTSDPDK